ncbi:MAG: formate--tetrahydrofolate ligase [Chloroflexi bacterium]|nr:formate--tetrahydrofolate ligase [Chloroflexota bacterium]
MVALVSTTTLRPIVDVAAEAGLERDEIECYGRYKAKVSLQALARRQDQPNARVVLVTAINPTPSGEGKTVTTIATGQALRHLGERTIVCLREPSAGPLFGMKGGATGGGCCTVEPAQDINLHFTGDFHAVTAANNLLAALLDNHIYRRREPLLDYRRVTFNRTLDVNDRALRHAIIGLGTAPREAHFDITAACEVMAVLALARDYVDLKRRLSRIIVGTTRQHESVTAKDLGAAGAMAALLRDALHPNLVQTQEGGPALVHTGPFGNIAHGTSSLTSLLLAQKLGDYVVVEAGFGSDLGAEKFVNLVGAHGAPHPDVAVVVATVRALKYHGGVPANRLGEPQMEALEQGLAHLRHHVSIVQRLGMRPVICINRFPTDAAEELDTVKAAALAWDIPVAISRGFADGSQGALELAALVRQTAEKSAAPVPKLYTLDTPLAEKIRLVAREIYGAADVAFSETAKGHLDYAEQCGYSRLPVCMAKTQYSLSDNPALRNVPQGFTVQVRDVTVRGGAGYVLALAGDIMTMPALPGRPNARSINLDKDGTITGIG